ncbi:hypothetical protein HPP92_020852, partial [Vanilla planifolia]
MAEDGSGSGASVGRDDDCLQAQTGGALWLQAYCSPQIMESQAKQQLLKVVEERFLATGNGLRHFAARSSLDSAQYSHSGDTVLGRIGAHETLQSSCPSCWKLVDPLVDSEMSISFHIWSMG